MTRMPHQFSKLAMPSRMQAMLMIALPIRFPLQNRSYCTQEDIADDENEDLFEECDDVFYEHEQLIIDIIYEAAKTFTP